MHVNSLRQALRTATQETDDVREESEDSIHIIAFFILEIDILSLELPYRCFSGDFSDHCVAGHRETSMVCLLGWFDKDLCFSFFPLLCFIQQCRPDLAPVRSYRSYHRHYLHVLHFYHKRFEDNLIAGISNKPYNCWLIADY